MNFESDLIILMTATVSPNGMCLTKLQNAETRKAQYLHAINYYLEHTPFKIVFCENTGTYLFHEIRSPKKYERLEYLTFNNNDRKDLGKGYGEARIIKYAINNSQFIRQANYIIKVTGRVIIENIKELLKIQYSSESLIVLEFTNIEFAASVCFISPKSWLLQFSIEQIRKCEENNIDVRFEKTLSESLITTPDLKIKEFYPLITGISGYSGTPYINEPKYQRKLNHYGVLVSVYKIRKEYGKRIIAYIKWIYWIFYRKVYLLFSH